MVQLSIKFASALVLAAFSAQAAPLVARQCAGGQCAQSASSGNVDLASTTNITPVTNVTPVTRLQPYVHAYAPIVESDCYPGSFGGLGGLAGQGLLGTPAFGTAGLGASGLLGTPAFGAAGLGASGLLGAPGPGVSLLRNRFMKRQAPQAQSQAPDQGNLLFSQFQSGATCSAQNGQSCDTSVPASTVDLGSQVAIQPTTQVLPSTTYQNQVQSLDTNIQATPAQSNSLPQQNVNLGSNVSIQPTTQVLPQTTYQPTVNQLTTSVQATPQQDQSLPQSSVQLGSHVSITPMVQVRPITTFQPSIQSLPFIINAAPCSTVDLAQPGGAAQMTGISNMQQQQQVGGDFAQGQQNAQGNIGAPIAQSQVQAGAGCA